MQHYQLGQKIGDFTISSFNTDTRYYTLTCECGNTTTGDSTHVTRKISNLLSEGFTACMQCSHKKRTELKTRFEKMSELYTFKDVYREYVNKSKEREIDFELSLEQATPLFTSNCSYCNRPPSNVRKRNTGQEVKYQGIDRVDNTKGYTVENTVPCCKYCNSFKNDRSVEDFFSHVSEIYFYKVQRPERKLVDSSESKWETPQVGEDMV